MDKNNDPRNPAFDVDKNFCDRCGGENAKDARKKAWPLFKGESNLTAARVRCKGCDSILIIGEFELDG